MVPEEKIFKRRHYGTPESFSLIITNYVVMAIIMSIFGTSHMHWMFWVSLGLLAAYNFNIIRRNRSEFQGAQMIGYVISLFGLVGMFFLFHYGTHR